MALFRKRASDDEALDLERAWTLVGAARLSGNIAPTCPSCGHPDVQVSPLDRYSHSLDQLPEAIRCALVHPSCARAYVVGCASCGAGFAAITMGAAP